MWEESVKIHHSHLPAETEKHHRNLSQEHLYTRHANDYNNHQIHLTEVFLCVYIWIYINAFLKHCEVFCIHVVQIQGKLHIAFFILLRLISAQSMHFQTVTVKIPLSWEQDTFTNRRQYLCRICLPVQTTAWSNHMAMVGMMTGMPVEHHYPLIQELPSYKAVIQSH
jgi:hypothetical protein